MGNKTFQTKEDFNPTPYMKYPRHVQDISTPVKIKTFQLIINKDISTPSNIISSYLITYKLQDFWTDGQTDG